MQKKHYAVVSSNKLIAYIVNAGTLKLATQVAKKWSKKKTIKLVEVKFTKKVGSIFNTNYFGVDDWELNNSSKIKLFDAGIQKNKRKKKPEPVPLVSYSCPYNMVRW